MPNTFPWRWSRPTEHTPSMHFSEMNFLLKSCILHFVITVDAIGRNESKSSSVHFPKNKHNVRALFLMEDV